VAFVLLIGDRVIFLIFLFDLPPVQGQSQMFFFLNQLRGVPTGTSQGAFLPWQEACLRV
jgi:hypothetical protein